MEAILQEWEDFAKTIFPENRMTTISELRDHAKKMLILIVKNLESPSSNEKQKNLKTNELILASLGEKNTPAERHGFLLMQQGFSINEMVAEYRALRASVIKLFNNATTLQRSMSISESNDLTVFNEAIDQALAESISSYSFFKEKQTSIFNGMLSVNPDLHYTLDLDGNIIYMNSAMKSFYAKPAYKVLGKALYNIAMPLVADVNESIQYVIKTGNNCRGEVVNISPSGKERFFQYTYGPIFDDDGNIEAIAGTSRDITDQKMVEREIWRNANFDSLTGLANRLRYRDKLDQALKFSKRSGHSMALLFIDLDQFKTVNDDLGHDNGDRLLKKTADRICTCIRDTDTAARMGGDEFTVILTDVRDAEQAKKLAEKLLFELRQPFHIKRKIVHITASIGITISPQDGIKPDKLLGNADRAMYVAKKAGKNCYSLYKAQ